MGTALIKTRDIVTEFARGTKHKDIELLKSLLSRDGIFQVQDNDLEVQLTDRQAFLKWYEAKLENTIITNTDYDHCIHCSTGNRVVLFNNGKFPRTVKDDSERSKTGLMLEITDDQVTSIKFCFSFLKIENKYIFECRGEKIKEYIKQGLSTKEAKKKARQISTPELF